MSGPDHKQAPSEEERAAARNALRIAILRAQKVLGWNEIVRVLAECPIAEEPDGDGLFGRSRT